MPIVPRKREREVGTAPLPSVSVPTDAPSAAFGVPSGIDLSGVERNLQQMYDRERDKADQIAFTEADAKAAALETRKLHDAYMRRGRNAFSLPEEVDADWQKGIAEIEQSLSTPRQRAAFRQSVLRRGASLSAAVQRHLAGEIRAYDEETTKSFLANELAAAVANPEDSERVQAAIGRRRGAVIELARRNGLPDETREQMLADVTSETHVGVISRFIARGDDQTASAYYAKAKDQIRGEHAQRVDRALDEASTLGAAQRAADEIIKTPKVTRTIAFEKAREITDPKVRRETEQQLDIEFARRDRAEREQQEEFFNRADEYALRGERAPATITARLTPTQRKSLEITRRATLRGDLIQTDQVTWYELLTKAGDPKTRDDFAKINLREYRDRLSNSDFQEIAKLQIAVQKKGDEAVRGFMTDRQLVDDVIDQSGLFPDESKKGHEDQKRAALFRREIDDAVAAAKASTGKEHLSSADVQKIADGHVLRRRFRQGEIGDEDQEGRRILPTAEIPEDDRNAIAKYLRARGLSVTTSKIERLFAATLAGNRRLYDEIAKEP